MPVSPVCLLAVPVKEILRIRRKYRAVVQHEDMTKDEFYALRGSTSNQIAACFLFVRNNGDI